MLCNLFIIGFEKGLVQFNFFKKRYVLNICYEIKVSVVQIATEMLPEYHCYIPEDEASSELYYREKDSKYVCQQSKNNHSNFPRRNVLVLDEGIRSSQNVISKILCAIHSRELVSNPFII